jgi:hypothetical protein
MKAPVCQPSGKGRALAPTATAEASTLGSVTAGGLPAPPDPPVLPPVLPAEPAFPEGADAPFEPPPQALSTNTPHNSHRTHDGSGRVM